MPAIRKPLSFKVTKTRCFEVTSHAFNQYGYAHVWSDGKQIGMHRHIWEQCFGPIPQGVSVCHHCDNPGCINPEHLFLGTHADNMRDKIKKGRQSHTRGEKDGNAKLTRKQVLEIKRRYRRYDEQNGGLQLAAEYGVCNDTIYAIISGRAWAHLKDLS